MSGLFSTFNVAKRGMFVQQKSIDVTSHNIANANTEGYSRQRAIIQTTRPFCMPSFNNAVGPGQLGTGSEIATIQRIRDGFMDFQIRAQTSTLGEYQARDKFLSEIENILNEPSDTGISTLIGKFFDSWQQLSKSPEGSNARTVVAQQSSAMADELNHSYGQLQKLKTNTQSVIKDDVFEVNNILNQIDQLNQQVISVKVGGQEPNDLMDKRDLLLDKLSSKFGIKIDKQQFQGNDVTPNVVGDNLPANPTLVKTAPKEQVRRFAYVSSIEKVQKDAEGNDITDGYKITYYKNGDLSSIDNKREIIMADVDKAKYKEMDECRVLWTDTDGNCIGKNGNKITDGKDLMFFKPVSGEISGYMSVQEDVDDYMDQLNCLAKSLAFSVNAMHSGRTSAGVPTNPPPEPPANLDADYMPFFVNKDEAKYKDNILSNLGNTLDKEQEITAGNISINKEIINNVMKIKTREHDDEYAYESENVQDGEADGTRALAIAQLRDKLIKIQSINDDTTRADMFDASKGGNTLDGLEFVSNTDGMKIDNYFKDTVDRLGIQEQEARRMVKNQNDLLGELQETRESISGVSMDEEMANMIQFQHAYQANAKIIATVDQLLDVVINGLKR